MVKKILASTYLYIVLAFMYMPILFILVYSFSGNARFVFNEFTFSAYESIFTSDKTPKLLSALSNTMIIALASSAASTVMGTFAAIGIHSLSKRMQKVVNNANQLPVINSEIVMAVSLLLFFNTLQFPQGLVRLILAHIAFCTPYVVLSVMPRLVQMDPNTYEAALDLGATPTKALWTVLIPILSPGIISGFVMSFTLSMDDFIITQVNKGTTGIETLGTYIYEDAKKGGLEPFWMAIFSIIFVVVLAVLLVINLKNASRNQADRDRAKALMQGN